MRETRCLRVPTLNIKQIKLPNSVYVYRSASSKLPISAYNFVIYFGVIIYFAIWPGATALLAFPGLMLVIFNGALINLCIVSKM